VATKQPSQPRRDERLVTLACDPCDVSTVTVQRPHDDPPITWEMRDGPAGNPSRPRNGLPRLHRAVVTGRSVFEPPAGLPGRRWCLALYGGFSGVSSASGAGQPPPCGGGRTRHQLYRARTTALANPQAPPTPCQAASCRHLRRGTGGGHLLLPRHTGQLDRPEDRGAGGAPMPGRHGGAPHGRTT
jgi:hypothetical protein